MVYRFRWSVSNVAPEQHSRPISWTNSKSASREPTIRTFTHARSLPVVLAFPKPEFKWVHFLFVLNYPLKFFFTVFSNFNLGFWLLQKVDFWLQKKSRNRKSRMGAVAHQTRATSVTKLLLRVNIFLISKTSWNYFVFAGAGFLVAVVYGLYRGCENLIM